MYRKLIVVAILVATIAMPATAQAAHGTAIHYEPAPTPRCKVTTTFTIVNDTNISAPLVSSTEKAVEYQVDSEVDPYWSVGCVDFGPGGDQLTITSPGQVHVLCGAPDAGCHTEDWVGPYDYQQSAIVYWDGTSSDFSYTFSHEVLETLEDPHVDGTEICDPVSWNEYRVGGVPVADFVLPAWTVPGSSGPWDYADALKSAGSTTPAGYIWTTGPAGSHRRRIHYGLPA